MKFEIEIIKALQNIRSHLLDLTFEFFTYFGEEMIVIAILGLIYWTLNKDLGKRLAMTVFLSIGINSLIKVIIARPRPFQVDPTIDNLRPETSPSYSMPSGHTQTAATTYFGIHYYYKKQWILIAAIIITFFVAFSRLYIGVHYISDVFVGALLGILIVYGFNSILIKSNDAHKIYRIIGYGSVMIFVVSILFFFMKFSGQNLAGEKFYFELETIAKMFGALFGFVIGIEFERKFVNFNHHSHLFKNILRFVLGMISVLIIQILLKQLFLVFVNPDHLADSLISAFLAVVLDYIRYIVMVFLGIGVYPLIFKKLKY